MVIKRHVVELEPTERDYWDYVVERQRIWRRRFVLKKPSPCTEDLILQKFSFTNNYRQLDRGTVWAVNNIIRPNQGNEPNLLFQAILYRTLPNTEIFDEIGIPDYRHFNPEEFRNALEELKAAGTPFTRPYLTRRVSGRTLIDTYIETAATAHNRLPCLYRRVKQASKMRTVCRILSTLPGVAGFLAYEVLNDCLYDAAFFPDFSEDRWVCLGPGAQDALYHLYGPLSERQQYRKMRSLWRRQEQCLPADFPYWQNKRISFANIENTLCETSKYWRLKAGRGRKRRFRPRSDVSLYTGN